MLLYKKSCACNLLCSLKYIILTIDHFEMTCSRAYNSKREPTITRAEHAVYTEIKLVTFV